MKSKNILERDNVKNAAEEEKKRNDKNQERFERLNAYKNHVETLKPSDSARFVSLQAHLS